METLRAIYKPNKIKKTNLDARESAASQAEYNKDVVSSQISDSSGLEVSRRYSSGDRLTESALSS